VRPSTQQTFINITHTCTGIISTIYVNVRMPANYQSFKGFIQRQPVDENLYHATTRRDDNDNISPFSLTKIGPQVWMEVNRLMIIWLKLWYFFIYLSIGIIFLEYLNIISSENVLYTYIGFIISLLKGFRWRYMEEDRHGIMCHFSEKF